MFGDLVLKCIFISQKILGK